MITKKMRQNAAAMIRQDMYPADEMVSDYEAGKPLDAWREDAKAAHRLQTCGSSMDAMIEHIKQNYKQKKTPARKASTKRRAATKE